MQSQSNSSANNADVSSLDTSESTQPSKQQLKKKAENPRLVACTQDNNIFTLSYKNLQKANSSDKTNSDVFSASELLDYLNNHPNITSLNLVNDSHLTHDQAFISVIPHFKHIHTVNMHSIARMQAENCVAAFFENPNITDLDLSKNCLDFVITQEEKNALDSFYDVDLTPEEIKKIRAQTISEAQPKSPHLHDKEQKEFNLQLEYAREKAKLQELKKIKIQSRLATAIVNNKTLRRLDLSNTPITYEIALALANNSSITTLNAANILKRDQNDYRIALLIHRLHHPDSQLSHLNLRKNRLSLTTIKLLSEQLAETQTLTELNLSECLRRISDWDATILQVADGLAKNKSLVSLNLNDNYITSKENTLFWDTLSNHSTLTHLNLSDNKLGINISSFEKLAAIIKLLLTQSKSITHLQLSGNGIHAGMSDVIDQCLAQNNVMTHFDLATSDFAQKKLHKNRILRDRQISIATLIAFTRANKMNALRNSILPILGGNIIQRFCDSEVEVKHPNEHLSMTNTINRQEEPEEKNSSITSPFTQATSESPKNTLSETHSEPNEKNILNAQWIDKVHNHLQSELALTMNAFLKRRNLLTATELEKQSYLANTPKDLKRYEALIQFQKNLYTISENFKKIVLTLSAPDNWKKEYQNTLLKEINNWSREKLNKYTRAQVLCRRLLNLINLLFFPAGVIKYCITRTWFYSTTGKLTEKTRELHKKIDRHIERIAMAAPQA